MTRIANCVVFVSDKTRLCDILKAVYIINSTWRDPCVCMRERETVALVSKHPNQEF